VRWDKPAFDVVAGTNIVLRDEEGVRRNSATVWLDQFDEDAGKRFKMFRVVQRGNFNRVRVRYSADGIHWAYPRETDDAGDRTTVFHNPFRDLWVYSLRGGGKEVGRCRAYVESRDPLPRGRWAQANQGRGKVWWVGADTLDPDRADLKLRRGPD